MLCTLKLNFEKLKPAIFFNFHYRVIHQYTLRISKLMQIILKGSKLWQLSACSVIAFLKYIQVKCLLQAENSMTGRGWMGEVLIQVWPKSIKK